MPDTALQQWLQLTLSWRFNARCLKQLHTLAGSPQQLRELPPGHEALAALLARHHRDFADWQRGIVDTVTARRVDSALTWAQHPNHHIIAYDDPAYPPLLMTCADPPPQLFVRGDPALLALPQLAVVGSRRPSADGRRLARRFARELVQHGFGVTSGLALGIDAESHEGALEQQGVTIAVLGSGLNQVHPPRHAQLADRIAEVGAVISEFPPDTAAEPWHFPERNRIISGLAHGVLVVEAAERSGSLITARVAAEQGREVFAIPGSINNPLARGCHRLLREGARLVEGIDDILAELPSLLRWQREALDRARPRTAAESRATARLAAAANPPASSSPQATAPAPAGAFTAGALPPNASDVLAHIGYDAIAVDSLVRCCGLEVPELLGCLLQLELLGLVTATDGCYALTSAGAALEPAQR